MLTPAPISQRLFFWLLVIGGLLSGCRSPVVPQTEVQLMPAASSAAPTQVDYSSNSETTWAFQPPEDSFAPESQLDLRGLNETIAGETGFVKRSPDGNDFVRGDGKPLRFWGINLNPPSTKFQLTDKQLQDQAEFLAKRGVNLVRMHRSLPSKLATSSMSDIDPAVREDIWRTTAAMKQSGIYVTLSPYWAHAVQPQAAWPLPKDSRGLSGLLFFDPQLQAAYKAWWKALLEPVNPYTGVALKDETAIALLHLQNEDSLLFWTIKQLKGADLAQLKQLYGQWLVQKYGSLAAAKSTWRGASLPGDEPARQSMALYPIWQLTQPVRLNPPKARRVADQTEFLTTTMRQFNQDMVRFLREEVGVKQLINANNWKTASTPRLNDAERYSYTTADVIGINRYYSGGQHEGKYQGWAIVNGDRFSNRSVLFDPLSFPLTLKQVAGYPMVVSESSWVPPLNYQSEGPFLISAYRSLLGIDGYYWFSFHHQPQWRQPSSANGYLPSLGKWTAATPELLGNFPAAALLYRRGYLQAAPPVVQEQRQLTELWQRTIPLIYEEAGFDPNRDQVQEKRQRPGWGAINPLAFLVGPVRTRFVTENNESKPNPSEALTRWINPEQKQVQSVTQEIVWDYGQGIARINAPKAQGATGFLSRSGDITLDTVTITAQNHYATVLVVSLDGKTLAQSEKVLVQVGTQARPTNWQQRPVTWKDKQKNQQQGFEILNYGQAPWRVVNNDLAIAIKNPRLTTATLLDMNGMAKARIPSQRTHQTLTFQMPAAGKYVLLSR